MKELVHVTQEIGRRSVKSYMQQLIARGDGIVSEAANQIQVGGDHYKSFRVGQQEHWDIVATHDLDYFQGQITKYTMRWKKKGGVQDLKKALHFLQKYIELVEGNVITDPVRSKAVENAILRDVVPTPTTPPFAGPGSFSKPDDYGVQRPGPCYGGEAHRVYREMHDTTVGSNVKPERDSFDQQDRSSLGSHLQRLQDDGSIVGVSGGSAYNRDSVPEQRSGRESTGPAEQRRYPQNDTSSNPSTRY